MPLVMVNRYTWQVNWHDDFILSLGLLDVVFIASYLSYSKLQDGFLVMRDWFAQLFRGKPSVGVWTDVCNLHTIGLLNASRSNFLKKYYKATQIHKKSKRLIAEK
jgi:hypothetical protein